MSSRKTQSLIVVGITLIILTFSCRACAGDRLSDLLKNLKIGSIIRSLDTSIDFYGRVLDQFDKPIEGAVVRVHVTQFSPIPPFFMATKYITSKTSRNGVFEVHSVRGKDLFINDFSKEGYEFRYDMNSECGFQYSGSKGEVVFVPDKNNPVIFRLRKKLQDRTFVFEKPTWAIQVLTKESGVLMGKDFIESKRSQMPGEKPKDHLSENCDLFYRGIYDEETRKWHVVLRPGGSNGGILVSDQMLYTAPEDAYMREWSFSPEDGVIPEARYLYLKTRNPSIYSRMEITYIIAFENYFRLDANVATNPYGDRVLDSVDMESLTSHQRVVLKKRLKTEAQAALREGRLPERPKIMALIEAAKRGQE